MPYWFQALIEGLDRKPPRLVLLVTVLPALLTFGLIMRHWYAHGLPEQTVGCNLARQVPEDDVAREACDAARRSNPVNTPS